MYDGLEDELQQMTEREQDAPQLVEAVHLDDPVSTLHLQPLAVVSPNTTLKDAIALLGHHNIGCLVVVENDKLAGIFTERDVIRRVVGKGYDHTNIRVGDYMTKKPDTLHMNDPIAFALNRMFERGYRHVPIVDDDAKPVAFVSMRDIVNHLASYFHKEILNLPPRPVRSDPTRESG